MFSLIAAIGKNRELGKNGELVFHLPEDMKYFKDTTMGHKVLMGRKTWESLPKKLANRENIVISRSLATASRAAAVRAPVGLRPSASQGAVVTGRDRLGSAVACAQPHDASVAKLLNTDSPDLVISSLKDFAEENKDSEEEIFVIGGGMVYWEMMKYANRLYLTEVDAEVEADTFFPEFDKSEWNRTVIKEGEDNGIKYAFVLYERK